MGDKVGVPPADRAGGADAPEPATQSQPSGRSSTGAETLLVDAGRELVTTLHGFVMLGCPVCSGDCASANPPVIGCPMQNATIAVRRWNHAIAKAEGR